MTTYTEQSLEKYTKNIRNEILLVLSEYFPMKLSTTLIQNKIKNPISHTELFKNFLEKELNFMFKENVIDREESLTTRRGKTVKISYIYFLK